MIPVMLYLQFLMLKKVFKVLKKAKKNIFFYSQIVQLMINLVLSVILELEVLQVMIQVGFIDLLHCLNDNSNKIVTIVLVQAFVQFRIRRVFQQELQVTIGQSAAQYVRGIVH